MATAREAAAETLSMLEERLARITLAVHGDTTAPISTPQQHASNSVAARLHTLERNLNSLATRSYAVSDLLQLHKQHPELFHPVDPQSAPPTLAPASLAQLVIAHENQYKTVASQLSILSENKDVPEPAPLAKLIALQPRIDRLEAKQTEQAWEFAELRARSASLVEEWYENGILDMGEKFADWEETLRDYEILVRRKEAAKKREEGMV